MNLGGSPIGVMDDCRKSQTLDSLPGKAGGLPILINLISKGQLRQYLQKFMDGYLTPCFSRREAIVFFVKS